jgi:hypothetical protein
VVIAKPLSRNDSDPAVVRIRNVDGSGFEIRAQEWDYLDGNHTLETVGYLVMESGRHVLVDGTQVEAGRFDADNANSFATNNFAKPFSVTPVVLAAVTSQNEVDAVVTRLRSIGPQGFKYRLQEQELNASIHDVETISYIAWEPSVGVIDGIVFEVGRTADAVSHRLHTIQYQSQFTKIPVFLADMQTTDGGDTASVCWLNKDLYEVDVQVVEEQSLNDEISHTAEVIGFMLFSSDAESSLPMEFGELEIDHDWTWVTFDKGYVDPVVVAKPLSRNGGDPATVRIRNVDASGFEIRVHEWDYLDEWHTLETVGYLVMERGSHVLPDGTQVEAGRFDTDNGSGFATASFTQPFVVVPVVLAAVTSDNEEDAVVTRLRNIGPQSFEYQLQEQELNNKAHATETVSYIAWEPSMGTVDDVVFEVGRTGNTVKSQPYPITYQSNFSDVPVFLADMQTRDGADPATVGWLTKDLFGIEVQIVEEQSRDNETDHTSEDVGYILVSPR